MPHYSVATTRDKLSSLIDKALAGEEVIITRHGKPTVEIRVVQQRPDSTQTREAWLEWLRERREKRPSIDIDSADLIREMRDEDADYVRDLIRATRSGRKRSKRCSAL